MSEYKFCTIHNTDYENVCFECDEQEARQKFLKKFDIKDDELMERLYICGGGGHEFYIKLERLGNKHFVEPQHEDKVAAWLKLTKELFG